MMNQPKLITWDFMEQVKMLDSEMKATKRLDLTHPKPFFIDYIGLLRN